jgi:hypothetical protein
MADRLRALLDRPLDPSAARAILAFASAILVGFAAVLVLAASHGDRPTPPDRPPATASSSDPTALAAPAGHHEIKHSATHRQDPQDIEGSGASHRAARALRSHRALQHVPFRDDELEIILVGARGSRAVLRVTAGTVRDARRGWHRFLRRYRDAGRTYVPIFKAPTPSKAARGGA